MSSLPTKPVFLDSAYTWHLKFKRFVTENSSGFGGARAPVPPTPPLATPLLGDDDDDDDDDELSMHNTGEWKSPATECDQEIMMNYCRRACRASA